MRPIDIATSGLAQERAAAAAMTRFAVEIRYKVNNTIRCAALLIALLLAAKAFAGGQHQCFTPGEDCTGNRFPVRPAPSDFAGLHPRIPTVR
jgi:hypothetical protein